MNTRIRAAAWTAGLAMATSFVVPVLMAAPAHADVAGNGGDFIALSPRPAILNTSTGVGAPKATLTAGKTIAVQATGVGSVPVTGVKAVLVDIDVSSASAASNITAWPVGGTQPSYPVTRALAGKSNSASAVLDVGTGGKINFNNSAGTLNLAAIVEGYFTTTTSATGTGGFIPVTGTRVISTTAGTGVPLATIGAGKSVTVKLAGVAGVPTTASAIYGTMQVASATAASSISAGPTGGAAESYSVMYYGTSNTTQAMALKLSSTGQSTIKNNGSAAINLYFDMEGYFSPDTAHGYGYRSTPPLSSSKITLAASADYYLQVGGRGGIPTAGAEAVVLSLSAVSASGTGYLRAYPAEGPTGEPNITWDTGEVPVTETFVPLGVSGRIRLHNYGSTAISIYPTTKGYFDSGESHVVDIDPHATPALLQAASGGSVDAAYVSAGGVLFHGVATADALDSAQWSPVPSNLEAFTGQPAIVKRSNGTLLVSVLHANNGEVWDFSLAAGASSWAPTFVHTGGVMASAPVSANLPDGTAVTFAVAADGGLWLMTDTGAWTLLSAAANLVGSPTVVTTSTGVQIVDTTPAGNVVTAGYASGVLSAWTDLGGVGITDKTAAVVNNGPRVRVVARQADGSIISKMQALSGAWPAAWTPAGTPGVAPSFIGGPAAGIDFGSGTNPGTGKAFLIARGAQDGYLYQVDETSEASGVWGEWYQVPGQAAPAGTDVCVAPFGGSGNNFHWVGAYLDSNASPHLLHAPAV